MTDHRKYCSPLKKVRVVAAREAASFWVARLMEPSGPRSASRVPSSREVSESGPEELHLERNSKPT